MATSFPDLALIAFHIYCNRYCRRSTIVKFHSILLINFINLYCFRSLLHRLFHQSINFLSINYSIYKCKKLSYSRRNSSITESFIDSYKLENVDALLDFDVPFNHKLYFNLHTEHTANKTRSVLGFIRRWTR